MKELLPNNILNTIYFSLSSQECLDTSSGQPESTQSNTLTYGQILKEGKCACLTNGSTLEIVSLDSGDRKAAWNFYSSNSKESIVCFCSCGGKLIIALKCLDTYPVGKLCIFDPGTSKILKTIHLNYVPTCVAAVREFGGIGSNSASMSNHLRCMFGIAALGTEDGHILLTDLRLDDFENEYSTPVFSGLQIQDPSEDIDPARSREKARVMERHCALDLSYSFCSYTAFTYVTVGGQIRKVFPKATSFVSCVKYQPSMNSLIVGYSFGCFQIWSLEHLQLIHSSPVSAFQSPVTHFVFQEPDDDPRHCCYLWVGRGPIFTQESSAASLTLYQMSFEFKEESSHHRYSYKNLECVIRRFNHQLTPDVHHLVDSRSVGSRIISFNNLDQANDSSLCYVMWECPSDNSTISSHLGIFDINRWYQKQLPASIRDAMYGRMEAVCPFFVFYSLTDIVESFLPNALLDLKIDKETLNMFRASSGPQNEQYYWPSASTFTVTCLFESASIRCEMLGIQRQIVAEMRKVGTDSFLDSQSLLQSCLISGLLPSHYDALRPSGEKKSTDGILTVNFENNGVSFIVSCIKKWTHGSITHAGYSVKLILEWAWSQATQKKKSLDQLHISLFSSLTENIETDQLKQLKSFSSDMNNLADVIKEIQMSNLLTDEEGVEEINDKLKIADHMTKYSKFLLLLVDMEFLPECSQTYFQTLPSSSKYPIQLMTDFYQKQEELFKNTKRPSLLIDVLLDEVLDQVEESGEDSKDLTFQSYPPTSVEELCDLYMQVVSEENLHSKLIHYWILDVSECYQSLKDKKVAETCACYFQLTEEEVLFVQSIWLLDHSFPKESIEYISKMRTKYPSKYFNHIIKTLYHGKMYDELSHLCSTMVPQLVFTAEEMKFLIKVYLELKLLYNAYKIQNTYNIENCNENQKEIFGYFLEQCKENALLGKLLTLSLSSEEENLLRVYLESEPSNGEFFLVFLLERGCYLEAYQLLKKLESIAAITLDQVVQDSAITRRLLVDGFIKTMPDMHRRILHLSNEQQQNSNRFNSPLSKLVKLDKEDYLSSQKFLMATLQANVSEKCDNNLSFMGNLFSNPRRRKSHSFFGDAVSLSKKPKEMPVTPSRSVTKSNIKRQKSLQSTSDAYSLLRTPRLAKETLSARTIEVNTKTPQSILKSKVSTRKFGSVIMNSEIHVRNNSLMNSENLTPRKIRFVGLSPTSPELSSPFYETNAVLSKDKGSPVADILRELIGSSEDNQDGNRKLQKANESLMSPEQIFEELSRRDELNSLNSSKLDDTSRYEDSAMFYNPPEDTSFDEVKVKLDPKSQVTDDDVTMREEDEPLDEPSRVNFDEGIHVEVSLETQKKLNRELHLQCVKESERTDFRKNENILTRNETESVAHGPQDDTNQSDIDIGKESELCEKDVRYKMDDSAKMKSLNVNTIERDKIGEVDALLQTESVDSKEVSPAASSNIDKSVVLLEDSLESEEDENESENDSDEVEYRKNSSYDASDESTESGSSCDNEEVMDVEGNEDLQPIKELAQDLRSNEKSEMQFYNDMEKAEEESPGDNENSEEIYHGIVNSENNSHRNNTFTETVDTEEELRQHENNLEPLGNQQYLQKFEERFVDEIGEERGEIFSNKQILIESGSLETDENNVVDQDGVGVFDSKVLGKYNEKDMTKEKEQDDFDIYQDLESGGVELGVQLFEEESSVSTEGKKTNLEDQSLIILDGRSTEEELTEGEGEVKMKVSDQEQIAIANNIGFDSREVDPLLEIRKENLDRNNDRVINREVDAFLEMREENLDQEIENVINLDSTEKECQKENIDTRPQCIEDSENVNAKVYQNIEILNTVTENVTNVATSYTSKIKEINEENEKVVDTSEIIASQSTFNDLEHNVENPEISPFRMVDQVEIQHSSTIIDSQSEFDIPVVGEAETEKHGTNNARDNSCIFVDDTSESNTLQITCRDDVMKENMAETKIVVDEKSSETCITTEEMEVSNTNSKCLSSSELILFNTSAKENSRLVLEGNVEKIEPKADSMEEDFTVANVVNNIKDIPPSLNEPPIFKSEREIEHVEQETKLRRTGRPRNFASEKRERLKAKQDLLREELKSANVSLIREPEKVLFQFGSSDVIPRRSSRGKSVSPQKKEPMRGSKSTRAKSLSPQKRDLTKTLRSAREKSLSPLKKGPTKVLKLTRGKSLSPKKKGSSREPRRSSRIRSSTSSKYVEVLDAILSPKRISRTVAKPGGVTQKSFFNEPLQTIPNKQDASKSETIVSEEFSPSRNTRSRRTVASEIVGSRNSASDRAQVKPAAVDVSVEDREKIRPSPVRSLSSQTESLKTIPATNTSPKSTGIPAVKTDDTNIRHLRIKENSVRREAHADTMASPARNTRSTKSTNYTSIIKEGKLDSDKSQKTSVRSPKTQRVITVAEVERRMTEQKITLSPKPKKIMNVSDLEENPGEESMDIDETPKKSVVVKEQSKSKNTKVISIEVAPAEASMRLTRSKSKNTNQKSVISESQMESSENEETRNEKRVLRSPKTQRVISVTDRKEELKMTMSRETQRLKAVADTKQNAGEPLHANDIIREPVSYKKFPKAKDISKMGQTEIALTESSVVITRSKSKNVPQKPVINGSQTEPIENEEVMTRSSRRHTIGITRTLPQNIPNTRKTRQSKQEKIHTEMEFGSPSSRLPLEPEESSPPSRSSRRASSRRASLAITNMTLSPARKNTRSKANRQAIPE